MQVKVRVFYMIKGRLKFLSHLETAGALERALRVAELKGVPLVMTEGFSPKLRISYSEPRSVGMESLAEHFDITLEAANPKAADVHANVLAELVQKFFRGFPKVTGIQLLPEKPKAGHVTVAYVLAPALKPGNRPGSGSTGKLDGPAISDQRVEKIRERFQHGTKIVIPRKTGLREIEIANNIQLLSIRSMWGAAYVFVRHSLGNDDYVPPMALAKLMCHDPDQELDIANVRRIGYSY